MSLQMRGLHYNQLIPEPWNGFATLSETYRSFNPADQRRNIFLVGPQVSYNSLQPITDRNRAPLVYTDTIGNVELAGENEGARLMKFPPLPGAPAGDAHPNDFTFFRLADMYLIKAEAQNESGDQVNPIANINLVRARHFTPPQPIAGPFTQQQLRDVIIAERLFEFAGEAKRRQDLIRHGRFTAERRICSATDAVNGPKCIKPARGAHIILMPVPLTQIQNNPLLTQNPGY
jgi:hypothetical protein